MTRFNLVGPAARMTFGPRLTAAQRTMGGGGTVTQRTDQSRAQATAYQPMKQTGGPSAPAKPQSSVMGPGNMPGSAVQQEQARQLATGFTTNGVAKGPLATYDNQGRRQWDADSPAAIGAADKAKAGYTPKQKNSYQGFGAAAGAMLGGRNSFRGL